MSTTQPNQDLQGQKALVTGATSGIGRAIAIYLARSGAEVIVHGRNAERGAETVQAITEQGGHASFVAADLGNASDLEQLTQVVGPIDILVNNAGISWFGETKELSLDTFDELFTNNVRAPYFLVAAFAPDMQKRGKGSIINVGSMAGQIGMGNGAAYGATKAAIASMTRSWASEFSSSGVRVNTIAPGPVYTGSPKDSYIEILGTTTALKRAATTEEIAEVVAFLASPRASYVTGAIIAVDGGRTAI